MKVVGTRVCVGRAFEGMREGGSSRAKGEGERGSARERESMCASREGARALKVSSFPGEGRYSDPGIANC